MVRTQALPGIKACGVRPDQGDCLGLSHLQV